MAFCDVCGSSFSSRQRASNRSAVAPFSRRSNIEDSARTLTKRGQHGAFRGRRVSCLIWKPKSPLIWQASVSVLSRSALSNADRQNELVVYHSDDACTFPCVKPRGINLWRRQSGEDIVKLFTQRRPEIAGFYPFSTRYAVKIKPLCRIGA